ncbi:uncharacterized protein PSFLO_05011 [Pseudozyma flocculosa]|uniref:Uncharacterized protein n=1 Tax=Pseudozyma flocculosa TaxID=84751 RepID=A0A5C3F5W7_9BASI|nr:uncharacterized protein PSFLO_05011 [Pseudozyma flocculosa]
MTGWSADGDAKRDAGDGYDDVAENQKGCKLAPAARGPTRPTLGCRHLQPTIGSTSLVGPLVVLLFSPSPTPATSVGLIDFDNNVDSAPSATTVATATSRHPDPAET